jgi:hypothetical protein
VEKESPAVLMTWSSFAVPESVAKASRDVRLFSSCSRWDGSQAWPESLVGKESAEYVARRRAIVRSISGCWEPEMVRRTEYCSRHASATAYPMPDVPPRMSIDALWSLEVYFWQDEEVIIS